MLILYKDKIIVFVPSDIAIPYLLYYFKASRDPVDSVHNILCVSVLPAACYLDFLYLGSGWCLNYGTMNQLFRKQNMNKLHKKQGYNWQMNRQNTIDTYCLGNLCWKFQAFILNKSRENHVNHDTNIF